MKKYNYNNKKDFVCPERYFPWQAGYVYVGSKNEIKQLIRKLHREGYKQNILNKFYKPCKADKKMGLKVITDENKAYTHFIMSAKTYTMLTMEEVNKLFEYGDIQKEE